MADILLNIKLVIDALQSHLSIIRHVIVVEVIFVGKYLGIGVSNTSKHNVKDDCKTMLSKTKEPVGSTLLLYHHIADNTSVVVQRQKTVSQSTKVIHQIHSKIDIAIQCKKVADGPNYVCRSCHHTMHREGVVEYNKNCLCLRLLCLFLRRQWITIKHSQTQREKLALQNM